MGQRSLVSFPYRRSQATLRYLPQHSPDLNPIEMEWSCEPSKNLTWRAAHEPHASGNYGAGSITKCNTFLAGCCDGNQLRAFDGRGAGDPDGDAGGWLQSARRCSLPWSQSVHH